MVNVCDPANFPPQQYFQQHEIPQWGPNEYQYEHTRGLVIRADPVYDTTGQIFKGLSTVLEDAFRDVKYPGVPAKTRSWPDVVVDLFAVPAVRNPYDFKLWFKSRVAIRLVDDFWRFSRDLDPFTTKYDYDGHYFDLLLHRLDGAGKLVSMTPAQWRKTSYQIDCKCISFFTQRPCRDVDLGGPQVFHGYSLNMDLFSLNQGGTIDPEKFLPMTIDPDVENKGGNPGP